MNFKKFVKAIGSEGVTYVRSNKERWLAFGNVFMRIPENIQSITAETIEEMPAAIEEIICSADFTVPCELKKAIMPYPAGGIKDCVRVFVSDGNLYELPIANSDYALFQKKDYIEMHVKTNAEEEISEAKALVIKTTDNPVFVGEPNVVGLVFPVSYEE